jgi:hypothetical protein
MNSFTISGRGAAGSVFDGVYGQMPQLEMTDSRSSTSTYLSLLMM